MSKRKRLIELGKDALILLLVLSAVLLIRTSGYFDMLGSKISPDSTAQSSSSTASGAGESSAAVIRPVGIVVSGADGSRYAAHGDGEALAAVFENFSAALGEALGSAFAAEEITESQWHTFLTRESVSFDFFDIQSLSLLSSWLGTDAGGAAEYSARRLCLCADGGHTTLSFQSGEDGHFYSCETAVSASALSAKLEAYKKNNAAFAFENEKYAGLDPCTVILGELPAVAEISGSTAAVDADALLQLLGMNRYVIKPYTEADGTKVYVENGKSLRLQPDGSINYRGSTGEVSENLSAAVNRAAALVGQCLGSVCGEAELRFAGAEQLGTVDGRRLYFTYSVGGIPVESTDGRSAAVVTVQSGRITQMELMPRRYERTETQAVLLPMAQAAAIAVSRNSRELALAYVDSGSGVKCEWVSD